MITKLIPYIKNIFRLMEFNWKVKIEPIYFSLDRSHAQVGRGQHQLQ